MKKRNSKREISAAQKARGKEPGFLRGQERIGNGLAGGFHGFDISTNLADDCAGQFVVLSGGDSFDVDRRQS